MTDHPIYRVRHGGLMRCCLATLEERMATCAPDPVVGEQLKCKYCNNWMRFGEDGAWEWDRDRSVKAWDEASQ
jgi:hypothetical protein